MIISGSFKSSALIVGVLVMFGAAQADAFRCGSRVIQEGMHQSEVIRLCGEPVSSRNLGYVTRAYFAGRRSAEEMSSTSSAERLWIREELVVTELVFNFGPRKLMRRLRFEGSELVDIRTMGYGYVESDPAP